MSYKEERRRLLTMTEVHDIRKLYFEKGQNITQIAHETGRDRKTIRIYLEKEDWNEEGCGSVREANFPKLEPYKAVIDNWLMEDKKVKRKQRHTAKQVYKRLVGQYPDKFDCSYRTVAGYVAVRKQEIYQRPGGYLPLEHLPGEAQGDFGEAEFSENGQHYIGKYLNLSFPYSNNGYLQLFKGENQECLFEGLIAIFEHIGGVPQQIWFDNTRTIVSKVMKEGVREMTDAFLRFQEHYRFAAVFCNVEAGHEKGNVENKVGYHRRNLLVPVPSFNSLEEYNRELLKRCDQDAAREHYRKGATLAELFVADKAALLPLPSVPLDVSRYLSAKTNGYGRFYLENGLHEYSVSPQYADCRVTIKMTASEVMPLDKNGQVIVKHARLYGERKQQSMEWLPYLTQLAHSPHALKYTGIYAMLPQSLKEYLERCNYSDQGKVLRAIAGLTAQNGFESALKTVDDALKYAATDIDSLLSLHHRIYDNVLEPLPLCLAENIPQLDRVTLDLAAYDAGLGKAGEPKC
jgi:transposase